MSSVMHVVSGNNTVPGKPGGPELHQRSGSREAG
jgi:hypothetical protein